MIEDAELLRRYVSERAQDAFSELVRRRIDLVYSAALRHVGGDVHLAEDVTQKVFADLARKAPTLLGRPVLSGWLYRSAQFAASDMVRSERRRRAREQETYAMQDLIAPTEPATDWDRMRPWLDEVLGELNEPDRDAVALRFFEGRAFADIGRVLRLTEEAARKRVDRALDKMAAGLSRRGVASTSAALGAVLGSQVVAAAPAGLATTVAGSVFAGVAAKGVVAGTGLLALLSSTKVSVGLGAVAVIAASAAVYEGRVAKQQAERAAVLTAEQVQTHARIAELERNLQHTAARAASAEHDSGVLLAAIEEFRGARGLASRAGSTANSAETAEETGPVTQELVERRYKRGQELARNRETAAALREFLWCYDKGMLVIGTYTGVRQSFLLSEIIRLGEAGREELRKRRDAAEKNLLLNGVREAAADFTAINRVLGEDERSLRVYDDLPAGDAKRRVMGINLFEHFVTLQRYRDAVGAISPAQMTSIFESNASQRTPPPSEQIEKSRRKYLVQSTSKHVEVLAGSGDLANARELAGRLLAIDSSPETRKALEERAARAGQPNLLRGQ